MKSTPKDVLFYVLNSTDPQSRERFLSKLLKKIWHEKRECDVRFENENEALRYDLTLWNIQPQSFIPHSVAKEVPAPIQLYGLEITTPCQDVLVNLGTAFPEKFHFYQRTIEILDQSEFLIQMGRERWKAYKAQGIEPTVHKIGL
ncbi:MAG: DNA polymerase III subunit chi [Thiomicrorhabdus sp.]|nr:DNA polymerase III subunit chi [Thiomicrorhabdus sp.]